LGFSDGILDAAALGFFVFTSNIRIHPDFAEVLFDHAPTILLCGVGAFGATIVFFLTLSGIGYASNSHGSFP
jgi:hypothetical protein